jgi:hypothetical protein
LSKIEGREEPETADLDVLPNAESEEHLLERTPDGGSRRKREDCRR